MSNVGGSWVESREYEDSDWQKVEVETQSGQKFALLQIVMSLKGDK